VHWPRKRHRENLEENRQEGKTPAKTEAKQDRVQALLGVLASWRGILFFVPNAVRRL
jgi:hypothetical protein